MTRAKTSKGKLTDATIRKAADGEYGDGRGLTLRVANDGSRSSWVLRTMVDGQTTVKGLGAYPNISIAAARKAADTIRTDLKDGKSVAREIKQTIPIAPVVISTRPTFRECAGKVIELRRPTWRSARHAQQWPETMAKYVYPTIGNTPVDQINSPDIVAILTPIWNIHTKTTNDLRQRISIVFDWCIANGYRTDNPTDAVRRAFPTNRKAVKKHHPSMPYADVPAFLPMLRDSGADEINKLAFEFQILNAVRPGEARGATWTEIDLTGKVWSIPAERMKSGKPHKVPLSDAALKVLRHALRFGNGTGLIFPNQRTGKQLTDKAFSNFLQRRGIDAVPHGFRSSFRNWAMECTATPWAVCERALSHNLGGQEVEAYARADLLDQRRELMTAWADYIG
jgi:integrase